MYTMKCGHLHHPFPPPTDPDPFSMLPSQLHAFPSPINPLGPVCVCRCGLYNGAWETCRWLHLPKRMTDSPPASLATHCKQLLSKGRGLESIIYPMWVGILPGLILYKSYAEKHSYCEFTSAMAVLCPKDSMSQLCSPSPGFSISTIFSELFPEPWPVGEG